MEATHNPSLSPKRRVGRPLFFALLGALTMGVLGACSSFIPDQQVSNPLALDSQRVAMTFRPPFGVQAFEGETTPYTFADIDLSAVPGWVKAASLTNKVAVRSAELNSATGPESITLSGIKFTLEVWQGAATYGAASASNRLLTGFDVSGNVVLTRGICDLDSCSYSVDASNATLGTLNLTGATLNSALTVISQAPTPNIGMAHVLGESNDATLDGLTLTLTLDAQDGTIKF